jgi:Tol biopolymer transport system component
MRSTAIALVLTLTALPLGAQSTLQNQVRLADVLPPSIRATQLAMTPDGRRVYYGDSARALWFYDRSGKRNVSVAPGVILDLALSPLGDALAYARSVDNSAEHHVWILPLDPRTGLASGPERRAGQTQGDAPAFSPDGKTLAFARDDANGVSQSVVVVPTSGGRERTVASSLHASVSNIRWSRDGRSLYFGVNAPVPCDPDWSCLALRPEFVRNTGTVRRVSLSGGKVTVVASQVGNGWPGLSTDGSLLAYTDTVFPAHLVVTDTNGRMLRSLPMPARQTVEGWLTASTLVFSDRGDIQRLHALTVADGAVRELVDSLQSIGDPAGSPDGTMIDMADCAGNRCDLRLTHTDGSLIRMIALPDQYGGAGTWSPDSKRVAYLGVTPTGERHLSMVDIAAGAVAQLAAAKGNGWALSWTPDSRAVLLSSLVGGNGPTRRLSVQRVDLDGTARVMREFALGAVPSGGFIVDANSAVVMRGTEIKRVSLDGDSTETPVLPKTPARYLGWFAVTPDRQRLAFRRSREENSDDTNVIEVVNTDGSNRVTIETPFSLFAGPTTIRFLGGSQLIVAGDVPDGQGVGIYLVDIAARSTKRLFSVPFQNYSRELSVSPDGRTILYVTNDRSTPRVFTMDLSSLRGKEKH